MEIAPQKVHQLLAYVDAVRRQGTTLSVRAFNRYAMAPSRKMGRARVKGGHRIAEKIAQLAEATTEVVELPESDLDYLCRLEWLTRSGDTASDYVDISELGKAMLHHFDEQVNAPVDESIISLDPTDAFSYARVIGRLADLGEVLLVDPYFHVDHLEDVLLRTSINRILMSKRARRGDRAALAVALSQVDPESEIDVRIADRDRLHDRYAIPEHGDVVFLGTSLTGIGRGPSVMGRIRDPVASEIRRLHNDVWESATDITVQVAVEE